MNISIKSELKDLAKDLTSLQKKQIPFAASQALNDTAFQARKALRAQAVKKLDRPTRFTVNGFRVGKSTKRNLVSEVYINAEVAKYLKYQIIGGTRKASGKGTGVPFNAKLNKFGNIPARAKGLIKKKNQFIATIRGVTGVFERYGKGGKAVKLIVAFEAQVKYNPIFPYFRIVEGVVENNFKKHMNIRLARAIQSAR